MFVIAIDSSHGMRYSGVASGKIYDFDSFYNSMTKICTESEIPACRKAPLFEHFPKAS